MTKPVTVLILEDCRKMLAASTAAAECYRARLEAAELFVGSAIEPSAELICLHNDMRKAVEGEAEEIE